MTERIQAEVLSLSICPVMTEAEACRAVEGCKWRSSLTCELDRAGILSFYVDKRS
jgi:hypothetical protein